jgi:N-acyl-D-amino-acid deacylase
MAEAPVFDLLIRGGTVIDGTGAPRIRADVGVTGDRIAAVGALPEASARRVVSAAGKIVAPGFIDAHTHDDRALLSHPAMAFKVTQGVTSLIAGNCGVSLAPFVCPGPPPASLGLLGADPGWFRFERFADYVAALELLQPSVNCGLLVGHTTLRYGVMDRFDRPASAAETEAMAERVDEAMEAGAIGVSTGLDYAEAVGSSFEEVLALVKRAKRHGGLYCSHHRNYFQHVEEALQELFRLAETSGAPAIVSHHQVSGRDNHGKAPKTLAMIEAARAHTPLGLDVYPYAASSKTLDPERAKAGVRILITWSTSHPEMAGRELADIAGEWQLSAKEAAERLLPGGAIYFQLDEADVRAILKYPHAMIGSDGLPHDVFPHPRLWGTFPRVLGHYSRDEGLFPLEEAVRRMTSLPAAWFGLPDRGVVREGAFADLVVFDPETVADRSTFLNPTEPAAGIEMVICNGRVTAEGGQATGTGAGRVLRRDARLTPWP